MVKDENVCLHCGLCAERCPTYAWDMRKFALQIPYAGAVITAHAGLGRHGVPRRDLRTRHGLGACPSAGRASVAGPGGRRTSG
jgi:ferredoxin